MTPERWLVDRLVAYHQARRHRRQVADLPDVVTRSPHAADVCVTDVQSGQVAVLPQPRLTVLILGGGPTRHYADLDDPTCEVWCCNDLAKYAVDSQGRFRADRWFELHPKDPVVQWRRRPDFWEWLSTLQIPVYQFDRRDSPHSLEFPVHRVIQHGKDYFGCTFAYQIGLALLEGFTTIKLYGVDLETAREATVERATVEWWVGFAEGQGVRVEWPATAWPRIRAGRHPWRYAHPSHCEHERAAVYDWVRDVYQPTIAPFLMGNRPPYTLGEYWRWRRATR